ncbi:hypothetical protein H072_1343 [Dactylellina haptotyla CBS 200.50]|uniref:Uncharacterized protein n=1 Tax=Dactylellina haptotyla (strain CBS 200.50) TaxID=1284197 RepID=S8AUL0_DACHA|nr:hypothetical protein H072_1343 [Dactylellina haptotyla CBS 200.50]
MFYDLNVPWTSKDDPELAGTIAFLAELGYNAIALNQTITGKIPAKIANIANLIPETPFPEQSSIRFLRRVTIVLDDPSQNYGLASLSNNFDIVAVRPTDEKLLLQACTSLECDLISLDLSIRHPFHFKYKVLGQAISRGIRFEITYGASINDSTSRRNLLQNAAALIRATKGKGIVISSEARKATLCRAPFDVINLATLWGLNQENGKDAIAKGPRAVMLQAKMKRQSFRGVIDIVEGGGVPKPVSKEVAKATISQKASVKRKAENEESVAPLEPPKELTPQIDEAKAAEEGSAENRPTKKQRKKEWQAAKAAKKAGGQG